MTVSQLTNFLNALNCPDAEVCFDADTGEDSGSSPLRIDGARVEYDEALLAHRVTLI